MSSIDEIRNTRIKKLELLKQKGINPYPAESKREITLKEAFDFFDKLEKSKKEKWISGRLMSIRGQGGIIFITLNDGTGNFQGLLKKDILSDEKFNFFNEAVDIGDFIEVHGSFFTTKRGEKTIEVKDWIMLSKSLRPLPEKWHGLQDVEERFRKRYLDILMNPELKELFEKKMKFWDVTRNFLKENGFLEVETPVLEVTTGGADAKPFATHHNSLEVDVYLRISMGELWQKKLMVAGIPKTFEIGRQFRNEGMDAEHLQDYVQMEFYWAYANYEDGMKLVEEMYKYIAQETFGTLKFKIRGFDVDLGQTWVKYDYVETIKKFTGVNVLEADENEIRNKLDLIPKEYVLVTLHRPTNVDEPERLDEFLRIFKHLSQFRKIIFPVHPRTRKNLKYFSLEKKVEEISELVLLEPLGYIDFLSLMLDADFILTDSGGIQEESTYLKIPCLTLRTTTERPVTIELGTNILVQPEENIILNAINYIIDKPRKVGTVPELWDGKAAGRIAEIIADILS